MDDILKFQRIQGPLDEVFKNEKICSSCIDTDFIVLGTESGMIYIVNFAGQIIKSIKSHSKAVNDISVDNNNTLTIVSCSDSGSVEMILPDENKQVTINFNEQLKKICIERGSGSSRKERSFIVGSASGRLIYHRSAWFTNKDVILFAGSGSEVTSIAWKGNLVAWCDGNQVRIMDISTQTAICRLNPPQGVGAHDPYPCSLFWQSDYDLLIGWADSFKQVAVSADDAHVTSGSSNSSTSDFMKLRTAKTLIEWQADCIICSVFPFDANHVVFLGYTPPAEEDDSAPLSATNNNVAQDGNGNAYPEILIAKRANGELVAADTLPLRGANFNLKGPYAHSLLSSYQCTSKFKDAFKWDLNSYRGIRGGDRGFAPTTFIVSTSDFIIARLRDVNDRTAYALQQRNLKLAVELAKSDKATLKKYKFSDLLTIYLTDLLERREYASAASECERLIENDLTLWEAWIYKFKKYNKLAYMAHMIPTDSPRLNPYIYEEVVVALIDEDTAVFVEIVKKWAKIKYIPTAAPVPQNVNINTTNNNKNQPQQVVVKPVNSAPQTLFNHSNLIAILQTRRERHCESNLLEAQAQLYILRKDYENALGCYMDIKIDATPAADPSGQPITTTTADNTSLSTSALSSELSLTAQRVLEQSGQVTNNIQAQAAHNEYKHVFELFDAQPNLFKAIEYKVINLVRLSRPLSAKLLIGNTDKLPIKSVASQLGTDKKLLFWYLHALFTDAPDMYCLPEFNELHVRQMELYAELAPRKPVKAHEPLASPTSVVSPPAAVQPTRVKVPDSDFLVFLKAGLVQPKQALVECERQDPPLFVEMIYILSQLNRTAEALQIHLHEVGDVSQAIEFIENQLENGCAVVHGGGADVMNNHSDKRLGRRFNHSGGDGGENKAYPDNPLWDDLIEHALSHQAYLEQLMDYLGICKLPPELLLREIRHNPTIPFLKLRLCRVVSQLEFQVFLNERCNVLLEEDALSLLRQQNQGQRKAMKVDSQMRCTACSRPIFMDPGSALNAVNSSSLGGIIDKNSVQIWGQHTPGGGGGGGSGGGGHSHGHHKTHANSGVIIFSNKVAFHKVCYERIQS